MKFKIDKKVIEKFPNSRRGSVIELQIRKMIDEALGKMGIGGVGYSVEHPADEKFGDYSTNVAMVCKGCLATTPRRCAEEIAEELSHACRQAGVKSQELRIFEKIEVAGAGHVNFYLSEGYLIGKIREMGENKGNLGESEFMKGKKVLVEYSSPNIAKRFSVGHLRSTIIGQALFNLYKNCGAEVTNDNHLGDWGTQFGMIIAAAEELRVRNQELRIPETVSELEELYVNYNKRIEDEPELQESASDFGLSDLEDLLDTFAAVRPVAKTVSAEVLARLIDDFVALRNV